MTWMRAAINGKDDEKFLGDETGTPAQKAAAPPPVKPKPPTKPSRSTFAIAQPEFASPTASSLANSRTNLASTGPATKPSTQHASARAVQPAASTPTANLRVKPALPAQYAPAKPAGTVKPALSSGPNLPKPKNQR
jgi:hypothetical protein